jgi:hypothetical protein
VTNDGDFKLRRLQRRHHFGNIRPPCLRRGTLIRLAERSRSPNWPAAEAGTSLSLRRWMARGWACRWLP